MIIHPAAIVHSLADVRAALSVGAPVTLLSAPGAALYAGCLWWRELVGVARAEFPGVPMLDLLDCADASGQALAAIRVDAMRLVLWPDAPGRGAVAAILMARGGLLLDAAPPALDLGRRGAERRLVAWLRGEETGKR